MPRLKAVQQTKCKSCSYLLNGFTLQKVLNKKTFNKKINLLFNFAFYFVDSVSLPADSQTTYSQIKTTLEALQ